MQPLEMTQTEIDMIPAEGPFSLEDDSAYRAWREAKLADYPETPSELLVEIRDGNQLTEAERQAMLKCLRKSNMVVYQFTDSAPVDKSVIHALGRQFGLTQLDSNLCADEDSITSLQVIPEGRKQGYIPYSNLQISWHTDGYYNSVEQRIRGMLLHCVSDAAQGGDNLLLDHEICYIHLRDTNPDYIHALMQPRAMTIPPNIENGREIRAALSGPVFSIDPNTDRLHMRYTARTRSIEWHDDPLTREASQCISDFLKSDSPYVFHHRLAPGQGVLCNNVLHARTAFEDDAAGGKTRLLYRARYYDRISDT
uniref:Dioxygenase-like protein n=1 Tax=uncultured bacterium ws172H5 TaxID=1131829 RepID=I1X4V3_9BACT|nr:dioxygenase-like protein [uncultured bacterium ws172H5]